MESWKTNAKDEFDGWSGKYDRSILQRIFFGPSHDKLIDALRIAPSARVLDVGCGTGIFLRRLMNQNPAMTAVGLDLSDGMIQQAQSNLRDLSHRIDLAVGDSEDLPFADNSFDAVTCVHSFHHYPNQGRVLREMYRVLKPNGQLVIVDAFRDRWWGWMVYDIVVTTIEGLVHHCSAREFTGLCESAGFESVSQTRGGSIAPFLVTSAFANKAAVRRLAA